MDAEVVVDSLLWLWPPFFVALSVAVLDKLEEVINAVLEVEVEVEVEVKVEIEVESDLGGKEVASWVLKLVPSRWLVE